MRDLGSAVCVVLMYLSGVQLALGTHASWTIGRASQGCSLCFRRRKGVELAAGPQAGGLVNISRVSIFLHNFSGCIRFEHTRSDR